jgi:hypothetical protein
MNNLTGKKFGKLTVLSFSHRNNKHYYWNVACDCGVKKTMRVDTIKNKKVSGCGCGVPESQKTNPHNVKHRLSHSQFYNTYYSAKNRCHSDKNVMFYNYGGRGIRFLWKSFKDFHTDMYDSFVDFANRNKNTRISLDRIDNSKGYFKENCRWATYKQQARNSTKNRLIEYDGQIKCLAEWAETYNIPTATLWARITRYEWSIAKALTTPISNR